VGEGAPQQSGIFEIIPERAPQQIVMIVVIQMVSKRSSRSVYDPRPPHQRYHAASR
jgi:hypothetical protein